MPLTTGDVDELRCGDLVELHGVLFTARDAAHKRIAEAVEAGGEPPVDFSGQVVYYSGPTPPPPGRPIGSCGPTTSGRMDAYTPMMLDLGLKGMVGKGPRSPEVVNAMREHHAVYFAAVGGAAALISRSVASAEVVAYDDLGPEAVRREVVDGLPCVVAIDSDGNSIYEKGPRAYRQG